MLPIIIKEGIVILMAGVMFVAGSINVSQSINHAQPKFNLETIKDKNIDIRSRDNITDLLEIYIDMPNEEMMHITINTYNGKYEDRVGNNLEYIGFRDSDGEIKAEFDNNEEGGYIRRKDGSADCYNNIVDWVENLTPRQEKKYDEVIRTFLIPDTDKENKILVNYAKFKINQHIKKIGN